MLRMSQVNMPASSHPSSSWILHYPDWNSASSSLLLILKAICPQAHPSLSLLQCVSIHHTSYNHLKEIGLGSLFKQNLLPQLGQY